MTHTTTVRNMPANENSRGNLAGFEISCPCGFRMGTTLACDVQSIQREHVEYMTRRDAERAVADKKARTQSRRRATLARKADPFGFKAAGVL